MASTLTPNDFKALYHAWSSEHLLHIITAEKEKYQFEAVYAAKEVLQERGVDYQLAQNRLQEHQLHNTDTDIQTETGYNKPYDEVIAKCKKAWQVLRYHLAR